MAESTFGPLFIDYTDEQQALRAELRAYFDRLMTPEVRAQVSHRVEDSPIFGTVVRRLGADGWLGIGWPTEYGGQGRSAVEQFIFFDEVRRAGCPFPFVTVNTVGPTLMRYGTDAQKRRFLPGILRGEINFAIGYTEPEAGTDLASLRTGAVRDGDEYVVNGNKVFTSGANMADFVWLACRTDPDAPKHKGISILIVPTETPGFSVTMIETVGELSTTATFYDDVHVAAENLVGAENEGWRLITNQLNHERVGLAAFGGLAHRLWDDVFAWARDTGRIEEPWVQIELARTHAQLEAMKLLNWRMACDVAADRLEPAESSAVKVYGTEATIDVYRTLLAIMGPRSYVRPGEPGSVLAGEVERAARGAQVNTFGGGVNEVQREIVAAAGLGMARQARGSR